MKKTYEKPEIEIPASGFQSTDIIYVRTFATKGTETEYGQVFTVTPASL